MYICTYMGQTQLLIMHTILQMCIVTGENLRASNAVNCTECDQYRFVSYKSSKTLPDIQNS